MSSDPMGDTPIEPGSRVVMHLSLALPDGTEAITTFDQEPEHFTLGDGTLATGLEALILGKRKGASESLMLEPEQAFGAWLPENLHALPRGDFTADLPLEPGVVMAFEMPAGEQLPGTIVECDEQQVKVDFNHPLAGRSLSFRYAIIDVAPAVEH